MKWNEKFLNTNLYEELLEDLKKHGKTLDDIEFVCFDEFYIDTDEFLELAKNTWYDSGFGAEEIYTDLVIVGKDWWLERHEYDGSEWFEYKTMPKKPDVLKSVNSLKYR